MSRIALACALAAGLISAALVAGERPGLGLTAALLVLLAGAAASAPSRGRAAPVLALGACLAVQPLVRDAPELVWLDVLLAIAAAALAGAPLAHWRAIPAGLGVAGRLPTAGRLLAVSAAVPVRRARGIGGHEVGAMAVARGLGLGLVLAAGFAVLFASADQAFADVVDVLGPPEYDRLDFWRTILGAGVAVGATAIVAVPRAAEPGRGERSPGAVELRIALGAVVLVFAAFLAVQLRVLFGGASYVRATTGLGYGDYARQGFVALVIAAGATLVVVGIAARRRDRVVRALLAALCVLTLVVLASAWHRLGLVRDAYGPTRVRDAGAVVVVWLAALLALVLAAGASAAVARHAPRVALLATLLVASAYSLSNPDARVASGMVDRYEATGDFDAQYARGLSADALDPFARLPPRLRTDAVRMIRSSRLSRDGPGGFSWARR